MLIANFRKLLEALFISFDFNNDWSGRLAQIIVVGTLFLLCYVLTVCLKKLIIPIILKVVEKTGTKWDDILINKPILQIVTTLLPCIIVYTLLPLCYDSNHAVTYVAISRLLESCITFFSMLLITRFLKNLSLGMIEEFEKHHLMGILQFLRMLTYCFGGIIIVSQLLGYNPIRVIAGLGAAATVLMLVFKDTILGLVAGIQLSLNNMMAVGDWITVEKLGINGWVEEISLTTVKIRNFDNSISTVPPYTLVSDSLKNWKGLSQQGTRRVKRQLLIDVNSIRQLRNEELHELSKCIPYFKKENVIYYSTVNLSLFRKYLTHYLSSMPSVATNQWILVRQLEMTPHGLPIELWFYTKETEFQAFENFASSVMEETIALLPMFQLKLFQYGNNIAEQTSIC